MAGAKLAYLGLFSEEFFDAARRTAGADLVAPEHYLVAMAEDSDGVVGRILRNLGVDLPTLVVYVRARIMPEVPSRAGEILTRRAKNVNGLALSEIQRLGLRQVLAEHLLAGILLEGTGAAFKALERCGATLDKVREQIAQLPPQQE